MELLITLPDYTRETGYKFQWEEDFDIALEKGENYIVLKANKEGLISLAKQFLYLAQDHFPSGYDLHYDEYNSLSEGSTELIVVKA